MVHRVNILKAASIYLSHSVCEANPSVSQSRSWNKSPETAQFERGTFPRGFNAFVLGCFSFSDPLFPFCPDNPLENKHKLSKVSVFHHVRDTFKRCLVTDMHSHSNFVATNYGLCV